MLQVMLAPKAPKVKQDTVGSKVTEVRKVNLDRMGLLGREENQENQGQPDPQGRLGSKA